VTKITCPIQLYSSTDSSVAQTDEQVMSHPYTPVSQYLSTPVSQYHNISVPQYPSEKQTLRL